MSFQSDTQRKAFNELLSATRWDIVNTLTKSGSRSMLSRSLATRPRTAKPRGAGITEVWEYECILK